MKTFDAEKIAIFGDWHGNLPFAVTALDYIYCNEPVDIYFHVGDFGFWPADHEESWLPEYLPGLELLLKAQNRILMFIDGNHEHFDWLETFPTDDDGLRMISEHIYHLPRGVAVMAGNKKIVGLGGALSIDRKFRIKDYSWFEKELITRADVEKALSNKTADILITHESPMLAKFGTGNWEMDQIAQKQKDFVGEVAVKLNPKLLVHGHHHHAYIEDYCGVEVIGLGCDSAPVSQEKIELNHVIVELQEI